MPAVDGAQGVLGEGFMTIPDITPANRKSRIASHERESKPKRPTENGDESTLFFDEEKAPVEVIHVPNPEAANLSPDDYEIIGEAARHAGIIVSAGADWRHRRQSAPA
jgi:transposase